MFVYVRMYVCVLVYDFRADINSENKNTRWTPLHCATFQGHGPVVMKLMKYSPDLQKKDMRGRYGLLSLTYLDESVYYVV